MQTAQTDLETAFKASKLPQLGYSFEAAINTPALAICLKHLAQRKPPQMPASNVRKYWWNKFD